MRRRSAMPMPFAIRHALLRFRRRLRLAAVVDGTCRALAAVALAAAVVWLGLRLSGVAWELRAWLPWLLLLPVAAGLVALRERYDDAMLAGHLDQRLQLGGRLLCVVDGVVVPAAELAQLTEALAGLPAVLPKLQWKRMLPLPAMAVGLVAVLLCLPPPVAPAKTLRAAQAQELERLAQSMQELFATAELPPEAKQELASRLQELRSEQAAGAVPEWRELDGFEQRLLREQQLATARALAAGAGATAGGAQGQAGQRTDGKISAAQLAAAAQAMAAAGLLDRLPSELRAAMAAAAQGAQGLDPELLAAAQAQWQQLAEAMAGDPAAAGAGQPGQLGAGMAPGELADLRKILQQFQPPVGGGVPGQAGGLGLGEEDGEGEGDGNGEGGRGGISRGPGHMALALSENAEGGAPQVLPLPPGRALPGDWVPLGSSLREPEVRPENNTAAGGAGAAGLGGASWQLDLSPRQREVVRRFFATPGKEPR